MQSVFDRDDETSYFTAKRELLDQLRDWLGEQSAFNDGADERTAVANMFLDYCWNYSQPDWTTFHVGQIDNFLTGFVPRKYAGSADEAPDICWGVSSLIHFLAVSGHLLGGLDAAAPLMARAESQIDAVRRAMSDPTNFGMGKQMFSVPLSDAAGNPLADMQSLLAADADLDLDDLQAVLDQRMAAFNALPEAQRRALTNPMFDSMAPDPIEIPVLHIPPTEPEIEESAASSELVVQVEALVREIGAGGLPLTASGYLKPADGLRLIELIGTWDVREREVFGIRTLTSTADLRWLMTVYDIAAEVGALDVLKTKVRAAGSWAERSIARRAAAICDAYLCFGPLDDLYGGTPRWADAAAFLDDGIPHWMSFALPADAEVEIDMFVSQLLDGAEVVLGHMAGADGELSEYTNDWLIDRYFFLFELLRFAGLIEVDGRHEYESSIGLPAFEGGRFWLTALGREVFPAHVREAGYTFPTLADLPTADASTVLDVIATHSIEVDDVLARWRVDEPIVERARLITAAAADATMGAVRLVAFQLLRELGSVDEVAPVVRELLDSGCAGHAAMFLLDVGAATDDEIGQFVSVAPLVDMLATVLGEPEVMAAMFAEVQEATFDDLFEEIWRVDQSETAEVLAMLGKHLADKQSAKAARRALNKHRSWIANRH